MNATKIKMDRLIAGERVVCSDADLDASLALASVRTAGEAIARGLTHAKAETMA